MWKRVAWSLEICFTFIFQCQRETVSLFTLRQASALGLVRLIYVIKKVYSVLEYSISYAELLIPRPGGRFYAGMLRR
jgi:hypothetical protein